jgi:enamine deaminase RidA (YjgF/YER057c/UK114 family)
MTRLLAGSVVVALVSRVWSVLVTVDEGRAAARQAALNVLAQIRVALGSFNYLEGLARIEGHVAVAPGFADAPVVLDGASELFVAALGDRGRHARTAFVHAALPLGMTIELVATVKVRVAGRGA